MAARRFRRHRIAILGVVAAAFLVFGTGGAQAVSRPPLGVPDYLTERVDGEHFVVHYTADPSHSPDQLSTPDANALLGRAETAYSYYVDHWGYPPPVNDGDGKTDIYVFNIPIGPAAGADNQTADQTSGYVMLTPSAVNQYAVAHELFHVIQFGMYTHTGFFSESSAEWAGQAVAASTGGTPPPNWFPDPQTSLDCLGSSCGDAPGGYRGSIFWEYLSERFGAGFVREAYDQDRALAAAAGDHQSHDLQALSDVLAAHGSSLADAFDGYALAAVAGQITRPGVLPNLPVADHTLYVGLPISFPPSTVSVNHLALKRIAFIGGDSGQTSCETATLHLEVDLPAGIPTRPFFVTYPPSGLPPATAVYPLTVSGAVASATVPWHICASQLGSLTLPNASSTSDAQVFTVHVTVTEPTPPPPSRPRLSGLTLTPNRFRAARRGASIGKKKTPPIGTTISYRDDQASTTRFTVRRATTGVQQGGHCVPLTKSNRRRTKCTRWVPQKGSFARHDAPGTNRFRFSGRLNGKALAAGGYRLYATPTIDNLGGSTAWTPFTILR